MSSSQNALKPLKVTVVAADDLSKLEVLRLNDPFVIITVDAEQTHKSSTIGRILNSHRSKNFDIEVRESSIITIQIFNQRKFMRRDQEFIGAVDIRVSDVIDLELSGSEMLTLYLRKFDDDPVVDGKLVVYLSTNVSQPVSNPGPPQVPEVTETPPRMDVNDSSVPVSNPSGRSLSLSRQTSAEATSNITITPAPTMQMPSNSIPHVTNPELHDARPQPQPHQQSLQPRPLSGSNPPQVINPVQQNHGPMNPSQSVGPQQNLNPHEDQFGPLPPGWERKIDPLGRIYYVGHNTKSMTRNSHNTKTTARDDPRMPSSLGANVPQHRRDYRRKLIYLRSQPAMRIQPGSCQIKVRRNHTFEDSYVKIMGQTPNNLKKPLMIEFDGEGVLDYGDLSREFFSLLSHEMFNPFYCLFEYSTHDEYALRINPASGANPEHLNYFKFIGRCLGLGIFHRGFQDVYFIVAFYKMILKKKVVIADLESVDTELYRDLTWMLDNDIPDIFDKMFTTTEKRFGETITIELKPGGADTPVTEENKKDYVDTVVEYRISKCVKKQSKAFMAGFREIIPQDLINVFDERGLKLLIGGIPQIDVDDWSKFTDYGGYERTDEIIRWFWQYVRSLPPGRRSRLLQFATGTPRIPVTGFKDLQGSNGPCQFTIEKSGDPSQLPKSHTCFNRIDLPPYKDYATLENKLKLAVEETTGSGQE